MEILISIFFGFIFGIFTIFGLKAINLVRQDEELTKDRSRIVYENKKLLGAGKSNLEYDNKIIEKT